MYLCLLLENDGAFSPVEFHFLRLENCSFVSRRFCLLYFVFVLRKRNFFREASSFFTRFFEQCFWCLFLENDKTFSYKASFFVLHRSFFVFRG